ncbi:2-polyprenyl-6-methoxyphenol hydroxylase-like FAD-dependent oxidoreductase [Paenibacillus phyllosphaerae]|uniref:2-polyprenyl-6-methoxyphenol hydroxylase-like FAD-dependent oxidoreductase n=1 Tax=Paenibacillus phyllosphaerae TaxID=274593 RepID=A0A7W5AXT7_9BACL|nr:NAD(P)/FAD-dependent oxidoreductase [Paenibacillus phyllosphaerae]MBB3110723.1 2-polyprenyl-6-methoxyphenol hydroxylase-like FAD-dependent oxidoreductase [Paenibacillus phyllosphaerae]
MFDVIIVGARVAGASLAYELSKAGYRVLLLEKGQLPSDTLSTHNFFGNSVAMLREMGVLDELLATGAPLYKHAHIVMDGAVIEGDYPEVDGELGCLCVRRTHLDDVLFRHAIQQPGVTAIQGFRVTELLRDGDRVTGVVGQHKDGRIEQFQAGLVVGADGRRSLVRSLVGSRQLHRVPTDFASYVGYFHGYNQPGEPCVEFYKQGDGIAIVFPTSDELHVAGIMFPLADQEWREKFSAHAEAGFRDLAEAAFGNTGFPQRLAQARLEGPVKGLLGYDNDWYEGMGPGWALLGDALSFKDPAVGQGMHDAIFGSRELTKIVSANDGHWDIRWEQMAKAYDHVMQSKMMSRFAMACEITRHTPVTPQQQAVNQLIGASPEATQAFLGIYNYANEPEHLGQVIGRLLQGQA